MDVDVTLVRERHCTDTARVGQKILPVRNFPRVFFFAEKGPFLCKKIYICFVKTFWGLSPEPT